MDGAITQPAMTETEAIQQLKRGQIAALDWLVERYQMRALRVAFLITRDRDKAEDIVQDAFIRVYERIAQFDDTRAFGPWFFQIVSNMALTAARRDDRCTRWTPESDEDWLVLQDPGPQFDALLEAAETRAAIWQVVGELPPEQRAAVVLRYYLEVGEAGIADQLGCPAGTVKSRLYTARQRLRRLLPGWLKPLPENPTVLLGSYVSPPSNRQGALSDE